MKKTFVPCILVSSLFFSIGCYSPGVATKEELKAKAEQVDITVFTKDSIEYKFLKNNYGIQGDTLSGFGVRKRNMSTEIVLDASLSFADVRSIETKKFDLMRTILFCGGIGIGAVLVYEIFFHHEVITPITVYPN